MKHFNILSTFRHLPTFLKYLIIFIVFILSSTTTLAFLVQQDSKHSDIKETTLLAQGKSIDTPDIITIAPGKKEMTFKSPTFKADHEFNALAPHWKEKNTSEENREVSVRISSDGKLWSEWIHIHAIPPQKDDAPHSDKVFPETPLIIVGKYFEYKVDLTKNSDQLPEIRDLSVTYIDSRESKLSQIISTIGTLFKGAEVNAATAAPDIISREAWGNPDPTGNNDHRTEKHWFPSYSPTKQIFVHHTVNSNYDSQTNGAAVVRAIWQYHAKTLGWGDIGYNYLVDQSGKTYQGRAHGDNVTAGHVYGYNSGSMGVGLVGCFDPYSSTCQQLNENDQPPSGPMLESVSKLLAWSAEKFEIDPLVKHTFCKNDATGCLNIHTIAGHKDASVTSCPGALLYDDLQTIREAVAQKKNDGYHYSAKQTNYPYVNLGDNNELLVTLQFKNTGKTTWQNSGQNPIRLATANATDHSSSFKGSDWESSNRPATLNEVTVAPGGTGSFTFSISNPLGYMDYWHEYFGLVAEGSAHFGSFYGLLINTRSFDYSHSSQNIYTDSTKTTPMSLTSLSPSQAAWLELKIVNNSNVTWSGTGDYPLRLGTDASRDRKSRYCTAAWLNCNRPASLSETSVAPGAIATFEFPIHTPSGGGTFNEYFTPLIEGKAWLPSKGIFFNTYVNSNYSWSYGSQSYYTDSSKQVAIDTNNLSPGQSYYVVVKAKNTGTATWYSSGHYPVSLGTSKSLDRKSGFESTDWQSSNRFSRIKEPSVAPDQTGTFEGMFVAPKPGEYKEYFQPVAEHISWLNDVGLYVSAKVNGSYAWSFAGQQAYTDDGRQTTVDTQNLTKAQRFYFVVAAKNTGNTIWYKSGRYPIVLGTSRDRDRTSGFYDSAWISANRASILLEDKINPGETGHFATYFTAPSQAGEYKEYFQPVTEHITWLNDVGLHIPAKVNN